MPLRIRLSAGRLSSPVKETGGASPQLKENFLGCDLDRRVKIVLALISDELHQGSALDEASSITNISPSRLRHIFKQETGLSPIQYIRQLRMCKAKELLETTYLNIKQIMIRVGVNDESHFVRDFKKVYGLSPTQYRARYVDNDHNSESQPPLVAGSANQ